MQTEMNEDAIKRLANGVVNWIKRDQRKGGYWYELIQKNHVMHLLQGGWDDQLYDEVDFENWHHADGNPEYWWLPVFSNVLDIIHAESED